MSTVWTAGLVVQSKTSNDICGRRKCSPACPGSPELVLNMACMTVMASGAHLLISCWWTRVRLWRHWIGPSGQAGWVPSTVERWCH